LNLKYKLENKNRSKIIAITPGCPLGIGPEVTAKALLSLEQNTQIPKNFKFLWLAKQSLLLEKLDSCEIRNRLTFSDNLMINRPNLTPTQTQQEALKLSVKLALEHKISAIITGPISKSIFDKSLGPFPGHTEFYDFYLNNNTKALMLFSGYDFILGLATVHVSVQNSAKLITRDLIFDKIKNLYEATQKIKNKKNPKIFVLGLNPHAGENGLIGHEEKEIIEPVIRYFGDKNITGPVAADGFFGSLLYKNKKEWPDAVLAMTHDQGLSAYKLLGQGKIANITYGLKIPRTSPAHGTAYDIAQKNIASPDSMIEAIKAAINLC